MIKQNIKIIREKIQSACLKAGRNPEDIIIVAVTKKVFAEKIAEAVKCGITNFGESYFQEAVNKIESVGAQYIVPVRAQNLVPLHWHFIGHLQKNKVNTAVPYFDLIHSVDSIELLNKINAKAENINKIQKVLLQINIAKETEKFGLNEEEVFDILKRSAGLNNVRISGLMIIPPLQKQAENNRIYFKRLYQLSRKIDDIHPKNWENKYLSMGMSDDYDIAVEEGANMVRIGTAIFGNRKTGV